MERPDHGAFLLCAEHVQGGPGIDGIKVGDLSGYLKPLNTATGSGRNALRIRR
jgi:hypothetical protein